jgi:hypothetical protein
MVRPKDEPSAQVVPAHVPQESGSLMVESKLFRVPRVGKPETVYLFQVNVEINLSTNPQVSTMFTDAEVGRAMNSFFEANHIGIHNKFANAAQEVTRIELRGSPEGLAAFHEAYLTGDSSSVVYNLEYR